MSSIVVFLIVVPIILVVVYLLYRVVKFFYGYLADARKVKAYQRMKLERELDEQNGNF